MIRLTFEISDETHGKLLAIPHGLRKYAYRAVIEALADQVKEDPKDAITRIFERRLDMKSLLLEAPDGSDD